MADDRVSSIISEQPFDEIERLKRGLSEVNDSIAEINRSSSKIELDLGDTKSFVELNELLKELGNNSKTLTGLTLQQAKAATELERANTQLAKTETEKIKTQREQLRLEQDIEKQKERVSKAAEKEEKQLQELTNDYTLLSKAYTDASNKAKQLGATFGVNSKIFKDNAASAKVLYSRLLEIDKAVGDSRRQIGNYNLVTESFGQILRELPNAGISLRTFLVAISNNLSIFAESIQTAIKSGQGFRGVMTSIGSSLFGITGIINLAVLALTYFATNMDSSKKSTEEAKKSVDDYKRSITDLIAEQSKLNKEDRDFANEGTRAIERRIKLRKAQGASEKEIYALEQSLRNQEKSDIQEQISLLQKAQGAYKDFSTSRRNDSTPFPSIFEGVIQPQDIAKYRGVFNQLEKDLADARKRGIQDEEIFQRAILRLQQDSADKANDISSARAEFARKNAPPIKPRLDGTITDEEWKAWEQEVIKSFYSGGGEKAVNNVTKELEALQKQETEANLANEGAFSLGIISQTKFEAERLRITRDYAYQKLQVEIDYLKDVLANSTIQGEDRLAIVKRINELELQLIKKKNDAAIQDDKRRDKEDKKSLAAFKKRVKDEVEVLQAFVSALQSVSNALNAGTENRIAGLQEQAAASNQLAEQEIARIERTEKDEVRREERIAEVQAKNAAQQSALRAKEIEEKRRQASIDKGIALLQATVNTYAAVAEALPNIPKSIAVGVAGLAAIAAIAAAPLPQYEHGTLDHKGGKFIAGEKESELVVRPDGSSYWTDNKPTMYNEPKGTAVLNSDMINKMMYGGMASAMKGKDERKFEKAIIAAQEKNTDRTIQAIRSSRAVQQVTVAGKDMYIAKKTSRNR